MKQNQTLNKRLLYICCVLLLTGNLFGQSKSVEKVWKEEKDYLKYKKAEKYNGPDDWYGVYPAEMEADEPVQSRQSSNYPGVRYSPQQIQRDRQQRRSGFDEGGGKGDLEFDPDVERPDPITIPDIEIDPPDVDIDLPEVKTPETGNFWKWLLYILLGLLVLFIIYLIIRNRQPSNKKVEQVDVENDWNPEVISKTELELRLEAAMAENNYRECVRIYFTFILKELIRKSWIQWRKEKTNHHYVMEMAGKPNQRIFMECVRIYDLVWYGEYEIDQDIFEMLQPILKDYYKSLEPADE